MVGNKLVDLKNEITHYIGIPYFSNAGKNKNHSDNVLVGKGNAKEIALKTIELANSENIKFILRLLRLNLSPSVVAFNVPLGSMGSLTAFQCL